MFGSDKSFSEVRGKVVFGLILYVILFALFKIYSIQNYQTENLSLKAILTLNEIEKTNVFDTKIFDEKFSQNGYCGWRLNSKAKDIKSDKSSKFFEKYSKDNDLIKQPITFETANNSEKKIFEATICIKTSENKSNLVTQAISLAAILLVIIILLKQIKNALKEEDKDES